MPSRVKSKGNPNPLDHGPSKKEWQVAHAALTADIEVWNRLQLTAVFAGLPGELWESRHCPQCGSSINRAISLNDALALLADAASAQSRSLECLGQIAQKQ